MTGTVAIAGNMILDNIKFIDSYPSLLELAAIRGLRRELGGAVCNVGRSLARLDASIPIQAVGWVGEDEAGDYLLAELRRFPSIDGSHVQRGGVTSFSDVMTVRATGERTFFTYKGADNRLTPEDFPTENIPLLHVGYALLLDQLDAPDARYGTQMARALAQAQARGTRTVLDVVSETGDRYQTIVPHALKYADDLCVNENEAGRIAGLNLREGSVLRAERLREACARLKRMGVRRWVVIHMPELACGLDENGTYVEAGTLRLPEGFIKSSVGAGDAFAAGILYAIYRGLPLAEALRVANATAACSLGGEDSNCGVRPANEAMKLYDQMEVRK